MQDPSLVRVRDLGNLAERRVRPQGDGSSDRTIHFWNTTQSARLNSLVTTSQVTSLAWNPWAPSQGLMKES
jgi:hypothetical protein